MSSRNENDATDLARTIAGMTTKEKIDMLSGETPLYKGAATMIAPGGYGSRPWVAARNPRIGAGGVKFVDGPRGIVMKGGTTFPVAMARGATFDKELEERIGAAIGKELVTLGGQAFGGICVNLLRHPGWGRAQETFGEDTLHVSEMGMALTRGVERYAMGIVKHFALNSMENARFIVDVKCEERALHEIYLRHFKRIVQEANVSLVMSSYNSVNGEYAGQNYELLTEILKHRWGFEGAVMTDFAFGLRDAKTSILAGQDLEMPFRQQFAAHLPNLVKTGQVPMSRIDDAVLRLLRVQRKERLTVNSFSKHEHQQLSLECARKSIVLLKNDGDLLPLRDGQKIAVFGSLANVPNTGDHGSSNTQPEHVITCLEGLYQVFGKSNVTYVEASANERAVAKAASEHQVSIVVVGYDYRTEGEYLVPTMRKEELALFPLPRFREVPDLFRLIYSSLQLSVTNQNQSFSRGGDRADLRLSPSDEKLIEMVTRHTSNVIVVLMCGSVVICEAWRHKVSTILCVWYPGEMGGLAAAEIIRGFVNPSGRLPVSFPKRPEDLPFFDRFATHIEYDYWHGYRKLEVDGNSPAFPFGFGLSFTRFELISVEVMQFNVNHDDLLQPALEILVKVRNCGNVPGDEVIQVYSSAMDSKVKVRPRKELIAFDRVGNCLPLQIRELRMVIKGERLAYYNEAKHDYEVEAGRYRIFVARHALDDEGAKEVFVEVPVPPSHSRL